CYTSPLSIVNTVRDMRSLLAFDDLVERNFRANFLISASPNVRCFPGFSVFIVDLVRQKRVATEAWKKLTGAGSSGRTARKI
ncbi:hypothetical protein L9F63_024270, partial [Diploptera punctata]